MSIRDPKESFHLIPRGQGHEFLNALERAEADTDDLQAIIQNHNAALELVAAIHKISAKYGQTSVRDAAAIMGENFIGFNEAEQIFFLGTRISEQERRRVGMVPFSRKILSEYKTSHLLIYIPPGTLQKLMNPFRFMDDFAGRRAEEKGWKFWQERRHGQWHLIAKELLLVEGNRFPDLPPGHQKATVRALLAKVCVLWVRKTKSFFNSRQNIMCEGRTEHHGHLPMELIIPGGQDQLFLSLASELDALRRTMATEVIPSL